MIIWIKIIHFDFILIFCVSHSVVSDSFCEPVDYISLGSPVYGVFQARKTGVGSHFLLRGIKPGSPALQADSLLSEIPGKPIFII